MNKIIANVDKHSWLRLGYAYRLCGRLISSVLGKSMEGGVMGALAFRRVRALLMLMGALLVLPTAPAHAAIVTQVDDFNDFSCSGSWQQHPLNIGTLYLSRYKACNNGWMAYVGKDAGSNAPQPVDNELTASVSTATGYPNSGLAASLAPGTNLVGYVSGQGWSLFSFPMSLVKTFAVRPGAPITGLSMKAATYGTGGKITVYDGRVTDLADGVLPPVLGTGTIPYSTPGSTYTATVWSDVAVGASTPSSHFVTVVILANLFSRGDGQDSYYKFLVDDVTIAQDVPAQAAGTYGEAWVAYAPDNGLLPIGQPTAVVTDAGGNAYVTGGGGGTYGDYDIRTTKYDGAGNAVWTRATGDAGADRGTAIAVDSAGNTYVTGWTTNGAGNKDILTTKYNAVGFYAGEARYDNGGDDIPVAVKVDGAGNVFVAGTSANASDNDYVVIKYNSAMAQQWVSRYNNGGKDQAAALAVDSGGNAYVTGSSVGGGNSDFLTVKYSAATGGQLWLKRQGGGGHDNAVSLTLSPAGDAVYVTGYSGTTTASSTIMTARLNTGSGNEDWQRGYGSAGINLAKKVVVDGAGNVIMAGSTGTVGSYNYVAVKYDVTGNALWTASYDNAGAHDEVADVAVDSAGDVYVTGTSSVSGGAVNYATVKFAAASGTQSAVLTYDNAGDDRAVAMALGANVNGGPTVIVTGASHDGLSTSYGTVAYKIMRPDLAVSALSGPATALLGNTIDVSHTVINNYAPNLGSNAAAVASTTRIYLAPQVAGAPNYAAMTTLGDLSTIALNPGESVSGTPLTIPATGFAAGTYYLVADADFNSQVIESNEANNRYTSTATMTISDAPDLVALSVSGPATAMAGNTITVNYSVRNDRTPAAGAFAVGFVLSTDADYGNGDDFPLTPTANIAGLAGNTTISGSLSVTVPSNVPMGSNYRLLAKVDSANAIPESDENNNVASYSYVTVAGLPDLTVTSLANPPAGTGAGQSFNVTDTVANDNNGTVAGFTVSYYLSTDNIITTSDTFIGSRAVGAMAGGTTNSATTSVAIPYTTAQGIYYLGAIADSGNVVVEQNESNNTRVAAATIGVAGMPGGDASDGSPTLSGDLNLTTGSSSSMGNAGDGNNASPDGFATTLTVSKTAGATSLTVASAAGFVANDEVLIVQMTNAGNAGTYEFVRVTAVAGTTLTLSPVTALKNSYTVGAQSVVQAVRVPQYGTLTVPATRTLTVSAWNGSTGGILAFRATTLSVSGTISASAAGFAGGVATSLTGTATQTVGKQGTSYNGAASANSMSNNAGGGGGGGYGGAGGGYGAAGSSAGNGISGGVGAVGGAAYGDTGLTKLYFGSGGGGGGGFNDGNNKFTFTSGAGGAGGGIVFISAGTLTVNAGASITSNGGVGGDGVRGATSGPSNTGSTTYSGGGGGGAGGSVLLQAATQSVAGSVTASAGAAGTGSGTTTSFRNGGAGAVGRIAQVTAASSPDLTVTAVSFSGSASRGSTISVPTTVDNLTPVAAGTFNVGVYLSPDPVITAADIPIGSATVAGLAGNGSWSAPGAGISATIPSQLGGEAYTYRMPIVINGSKISGTAPLTDFPVLVDITSRELASFYYGGKSLDPYVAGLDILFYAADKVTRLDFDRVKYDPGSGRMIAWVRMPVLTPGVNTTIYVYYGNSSVGTTAPWNTAAAWNSAYKGVWHLEGGSVNPDSTSNANTASDPNGYGSSTDGKVGFGYYNNGSGSVKTLNTASSVLNPGASDWTVEGWVRYDAPLALKQVLFSTANPSTGRNLLYLNGGDYAIKSSHSGTEYSSGYNANLLLTWYHVALAKTGSGSNATLTWYVNGSPVYSQSGVTVNSDTSPWRLGNGFDLGENFKGMLDELRASNVARSAGWIATEYNNMNDPASFATLQAPQTVPVSPREALTYYLGVVADPGNDVAEVNETNNALVNGGTSMISSVISFLTGGDSGADGTVTVSDGGGGAMDALWLLVLGALGAARAWRFRLVGRGARQRSSLMSWCREQMSASRLFRMLAGRCRYLHPV